MTRKEAVGLADADRRSIATFCRDRKRTLGDIARRLGRDEGSINGKVQRMVAERLLVKGPSDSGRAKYVYLFDPNRLSELREAERAEREKGPPVGAEIRAGQRLLLIGGPDPSRLSAELRRLAIDRDAEWAARLDGGERHRLALALADDGPRCDEVEAAIYRVGGEAVQAKVDRFLDREELARWLREPRPGPGDGP